MGLHIARVLSDLGGGCKAKIFSIVYRRVEHPVAGIRFAVGRGLPSGGEGGVGASLEDRRLSAVVFAVETQAVDKGFVIHNTIVQRVAGNPVDGNGRKQSW